MLRHTRNRSLPALAAILLPGVALAHTGVGDASGFAHGFAHPLGGLDHILAMVAVGWFAAALGGRALWALPLTFMGLMAAGGAIGIAGIGLPLVEAVVALSVVVLGLVIAIPRRWPVAAAMALVGVFAIFHGHAHGAELPENASGARYALGFLLATGVLHLAGIGLGVALATFGTAGRARIAQAGGGLIAAIGVGLLAGVI